MSNPAKSTFQDQGFDAGRLGHVEDLSVRNTVLPFDVQDGPQAAQMEALQLLQVSPVQGPCLTTIEEAGENDRPVHLELRGLPDVLLVQDSLQAAKSLAGLADPGADLLVETPVTADHAAEVFEVVNRLQLGAIT